MPGLYSLARAGLCSVTEARSMTVKLLVRLHEMLEEEYDRRSEAARSLKNSRRGSLGR